MSGNNNKHTDQVSILFVVIKNSLFVKMKFLYICIVITIFLGNHANAWRRRRRYRPPPPKNCKLSPWSSWSACNHECGNAGVQIRTRHKIEQECCGGTCGSLKETRPCNRVACRNGGTPLHGRCSCRGGYTGTCCETGEFTLSHP